MMETLYPSEINYSEESIPNEFTDGRRLGVTLDQFCETSLLEHARRLVRQEEAPDIPPIHVYQPNLFCKFFGLWVSLDNRRLWVLKHLERLGKFGQIRVIKSQTSQFTYLSTYMGYEYVTVNGDPGGIWHGKYENVEQIAVNTARRRLICLKRLKWPLLLLFIILFVKR